jgi:hypothetical protein
MQRRKRKRNRGPKVPHPSRPRRAGSRQWNAYSGGLPNLFSEDPRGRIDGVLVALWRFGAMNGVDAARVAGYTSSPTANMMTMIAERGLVLITRVRRSVPTFVALNREHPVVEALEHYLAAVAMLWKPYEAPTRSVPPVPAFVPPEPLDGTRLFGHHDRTAILVYVAVLGEVRARRLRENLGLTQWQSSEVLRMWRLRGFLSARRVVPRAPGSYDYAYSLSLRFPAHRELRALLLQIADVYFPRFAAQYRPANIRAEREIRHSYQRRAKLITRERR